MVTTEFAVTMRVHACNMLLRLAKRTKFHASNMRTKEMLHDVGLNVSYCIKHVPTSSNTLSGHQTRWPNDKMLVHPTCWIIQHLSFGRALNTSLIVFLLKSKTENIKTKQKRQQTREVQTHPTPNFYQLAVSQKQTITF